MKDQIGDVVAGRVQPVELAVCGVREPGQRMPIAGVSACKSPFYRRPSKTTLDKRILVNVKLVVKIDELVFPDPEKCQQRENCQAKSYEDSQRAVGL